tara:strand:+ start:37079 stop:37870 length:792 start_codon:yes stop_codon:yes gene_type:complete
MTKGSEMSWYNNDAGFVQNQPKKYTKRFWMPNNTDRLITFIDTPIVEFDGVKIQTPFKYNEYQIQLNGSWKNWFTQPIDPSQDVLKEMGYKASKVAVLTVIDHAEWTDRNGAVHKDELSLYVVKRSQPIWAQLEKIIAREGDLSGKTFRVHRMGDKSPGSGSMLEKYEQNFPLDPNVHKPFNYLELLKPKSKEELEALFNPDMNDPFKQSSSSNSSGADWSQSTNNSWSQQGQTQAQNAGWGTPDQSRVFGATSNGSSDPIPF